MVRINDFTLLLSDSFPADWFSQRVEIRIVIAMMGMMAETHRLNTEAPVLAAKAQKKASPAAASAAQNL